MTHLGVPKNSHPMHGRVGAGTPPPCDQAVFSESRRLALRSRIVAEAWAALPKPKPKPKPTGDARCRRREMPHLCVCVCLGVSWFVCVSVFSPLFLFRDPGFGLAF